MMMPSICGSLLSEATMACIPACDTLLGSLIAMAFSPTSLATRIFMFTQTWQLAGLSSTCPSIQFSSLDTGSIIEPG
jgi:hypothetical protein